MQTAGVAGVRVWNAAPGVRAADVYVNDTAMFLGLEYGELSDYVELPPGRHEVRVPRSGGDPETAPLISEGLDLAPGELETVVVTGARGTFYAFRLRDNIRAFEREQAKVRLVHASPNAPPLRALLDRRQVLFERAEPLAATPFTSAEPGTYDLELRSTGSEETLLLYPELTLIAGTLYTLIALGLAGGRPPLQLIPIVEAIEVCTPG